MNALALDYLIVGVLTITIIIVMTKRNLEFIKRNQVTHIYWTAFFSKTNQEPKFKSILFGGLVGGLVGIWGFFVRQSFSESIFGVLAASLVSYNMLPIFLINGSAYRKYRDKQILIDTGVLAGIHGVFLLIIYLLYRI
jgi:ABC-type phosphate transport system permease subunit